MTDSPNKLSQFWLELKRRKVVRVISVYAASAFVILQLVDMVAPSLRLPEWTMNFMIVLLCVGFIIAVILSWIYNINPEGGIEKTEPSEEDSKESGTLSSKGWKIASYISFVVIIALIVLNIISRSKHAQEIAIRDKSIAVLPFLNDSPDQERMYFINGIMESILNNLCMIEDLRVPGRTSVEQYRSNPKPIPVVAEEMNVDYILEGSGHRDGNNVRLIVQLLDGRKDQHLWSKTYDADIEEIFSMQSEIAQLIAAEIKAIISPDERELIEKIPTSSLTAFDYYTQGKEEHLKYEMTGDSEALERAVKLYNLALKYDSAFAQAYTGLGRAYWHKNSWNNFSYENPLDSVLILADKAISADPKISEAYMLRGNYFRYRGQDEKALEEYEKAIRLNPNDWKVYANLGLINQQYDLVKSLEYLGKAIAIERGKSFPILLGAMSFSYLCAGYTDKCESIGKQFLDLNGDTVNYYNGLLGWRLFNGQNEEALAFAKKSYAIDSSSTFILFYLGLVYSRLEKYDISVGYFKKWYDKVKITGGYARDWGLSRMGYAFWQNGNKEEAMQYFNEQIALSLRSNELGSNSSASNSTNFELAGVYAFTGQRQEAYENLRLFNKKKMMPFYMAAALRTEPLFDPLRDDPEFQQIAREVEAKYQAEHERVRKWLEENDLL